MLTRPPEEVIPGTRQAVGPKKTMIRLFLTARKLIVLDVLSKITNTIGNISWIMFFGI
jgi:hypothetical protein